MTCGHTAASLLLADGVHPKTVSDLLGHSQVGITLNLHSHVTPAMHEAATGSLGRLLDISLRMTGPPTPPPGPR